MTVRIVKIEPKRIGDYDLNPRQAKALPLVLSGVLETKAPNIELGIHEIEQTISYARHPEIAASYAVVLNGRRLVLYHTSQKSTETPLIDIEVESPERLVEQLTALLSPHAIRRDCTPSVVDLNLPLAHGLRSSAEIRGGVIAHSDFSWTSNHPLPEPASSNLDEICRKMRNFRSDITGGKVWRDSSSRIKAKLKWAMPHEFPVSAAVTNVAIIF